MSNTADGTVCDNCGKSSMVWLVYVQNGHVYRLCAECVNAVQNKKAGDRKITIEE